MSDGTNKVIADNVLDKEKDAIEVENPSTKNKLNIIDTHAIDVDNSVNNNALSPPAKHDPNDSDREHSTYSTSDWASSVSTKQFIKENTLFVLNRARSQWFYIVQMATHRAKLLAYGVVVVIAASILVRLTLDGNSVAALFLDLFNRVHQGAIVFVSWHYYMPSRFPNRILTIMGVIGVFIYTFFHVINFAIDPKNYVTNRIYAANDQASTFWRCQV